MPLYEYQCDACGHRFERIQKFSDPPVETCPSCGGTVKKLLSSPAIQFKGSGWYITDYAKKSSGSPDGKPASSSSSSSSGGGEGGSASGSSGSGGTGSGGASKGTSESGPTSGS
jgi:putative FmdB family regulatory protein